MAKFKFKNGTPIMKAKHVRSIVLPCGKRIDFQYGMFSTLPSAWVSWHEGDQMHYKVREFWSSQGLRRHNV